MAREGEEEIVDLGEKHTQARNYDANGKTDFASQSRVSDDLYRMDQKSTCQYRCIYHNDAH